MILARKPYGFVLLFLMVFAGKPYGFWLLQVNLEGCFKLTYLWLQVNLLFRIHRSHHLLHLCDVVLGG